MKKVAIIGGGPAGLTAGIYLARAGVAAVIFERLAPGGQMNLTAEIDNYPGLPNISGEELSRRMREQAVAVGVEFKSGVTKLSRAGDEWSVSTRRETDTFAAVIAACGASHRKLDVPGENEFSGRGVSYCAVCDGSFFKGRTVAVQGGGNAALEDALYLAQICKKVWLIHRRDVFRADRILIDRVFGNKKIEPVLWHSVARIEGENTVERIITESIAGDASRVFDVAAIFIAVGTKPESGLIKEFCETDENDYVISGEDCKTSAAGLFAAGDLRRKQVYQIVTAVADGASAARSAVNYLEGV